MNAIIFAPARRRKSPPANCAPRCSSRGDTPMPDPAALADALTCCGSPCFGDT